MWRHSCGGAQPCAIPDWPTSLNQQPRRRTQAGTAEGGGNETFDMSIHWVNNDKNGKPFAQHSLALLIKSYLSLKDPSPVAAEILQLALLLVLSNHSEKARELESAVYRFASDTEFRYTASVTLNKIWQTHPTLSRSQCCQ